MPAMAAVSAGASLHTATPVQHPKPAALEQQAQQPSIVAAASRAGRSTTCPVCISTAWGYPGPPVAPSVPWPAKVLLALSIFGFEIVESLFACVGYAVSQ